MLHEEDLKRLYEKLTGEPNQTYDRIIQGIYLTILEPGDAAIDVGANTGLHTIPMARKVAPNGRVLAFEPVQENVKILQKRVENNQLSSIVSIKTTALSKFTGEADFLVFKDQPGLSGFKISPSYEKDRLNVEKRRVPVDTLDNLTTGNLKIKFIKIDAEGADFLVLQGSIRLIERNRPLIVFEGWGVKAGLAKLYDYTKEEFFDFFNQINYTLYDTMGLRFTPALWESLTLNDFIAVPNEDKEEMVEMIWFSALEVLSEKFGQPKQESKSNQNGNVKKRGTIKEKI